MESIYHLVIILKYNGNTDNAKHIKQPHYNFLVITCNCLFEGYAEFVLYSFDGGIECARISLGCWVYDGCFEVT